MTSVSPEDVFAAIRQDLREWRESLIPRPVWKSGVLQVVGKVTPPTFVLRYDRRWYGEGGDPLLLRGVVRAGPDHATIIEARCGRGAHMPWTAAVFGALALLTLRGGGTSPWAWLLVGGLFLGIQRINDMRVSRENDPEAAYLVARLEAAVAAAGHGAESGVQAG